METINEQVKKLEEKCAKYEKALLKAGHELGVKTEALENIHNFMTPVAIYHSKKRRNTTIKFVDGHSVTVKKMKGDKDCLHTAIAYALSKNLYNLNEFVRKVEEK